MRVLVIRPEPAASRTAERLEALGHQPLLLPLSRAKHDPDAARAALSQPHGALAITSAEAVRAIEKVGDLAPWKRTKIFAVGHASAQAARNAGFENVIVSSGDGAALADTVRDQSEGITTDAPLLYLAGTPRAEGFENRLGDHGIPCVVCECYRMEPSSPPMAVQQEIFLGTPVDAVLFYSAESARRFFSLPIFRHHPDRLETMRFYCLSDAIAAILPPALRQNASVAAKPEEAQLLARL